MLDHGFTRKPYLTMLLASGSLWLREPLVLNCIGTLEPVILAYQCSYYYYYYLGNVVTLITFLNSYFKKHEYQGRIFLYVNTTVYKSPHVGLALQRVLRLAAHYVCFTVLL